MPFAIPVLGRHRLHRLPGLLMSPRSASGAFPLLGKPGEATENHSGEQFYGSEGNLSEGLVTSSAQWGQAGGKGGAGCLESCSHPLGPFSSP